jgi:hypothetical protein
MDGSVKLLRHFPRCRLHNEKPLLAVASKRQMSPKKGGYDHSGQICNDHKEMRLRCVQFMIKTAASQRVDRGALVISLHQCNET